jgi:hypothetical protein
MVKGKKRVERIPDEWVTQLRPLAKGGRLFKEALVEVLAANAQLLALWRREVEAKERRKKQKQPRTAKKKRKSRKKR